MLSVTTITEERCFTIRRENTTRKQGLWSSLKVPAAIAAGTSILAAMAGGIFRLDRWLKVSRENFWYRVVAKSGTNN